MVNSTEQETLTTVLNRCMMAKLPEELEGKDQRIWARAIVKVVKCDNSKNYALAENDGYGNSKIIEDFGNIAAIVRIENIYPTYFVDPSRMPKLENQSDILTFLQYHHEDKEVMSQYLSDTSADGKKKNKEVKERDLAFVKAKVVSYCIEDTILLDNEQARFHKIIKEAKGEKEEKVTTKTDKNAKKISKRK